jgi:hypothetical protein
MDIEVLTAQPSYYCDRFRPLRVGTKALNKTQQFGVRRSTPLSTHGEKQIKHEGDIKYMVSPTPVCCVGVLQGLITAHHSTAGSHIQTARQIIILTL